jgi:hypothetical protein
MAQIRTHGRQEIIPTRFIGPLRIVTTKLSDCSSTLEEMCMEKGTTTRST